MQDKYLNKTPQEVRAWINSHKGALPAGGGMQAFGRVDAYRAVQ